MATAIAEFLEAAWLERARRVTGRADTAEALERLRPAVRRLSDLFTTARPTVGFPDYFSEPELLVAYGLFFFPQSFARAGLAFDQPTYFRGWRPTPGALSAPVRVLDLGSGAGPCGLAIAEALRGLVPERGVALTLLDHSAAALEAARQTVAQGVLAESSPSVVREFFRALSLETIRADLGRVGALPETLLPQDVIVTGFCVNELVPGGADSLARWLTALRGKLALGGLLLVLEPALRETALRLCETVKILTAEGVFHEWAPGIATSPRVAVVAESRFHPHEVRTWTPPESLAFLNRELFREAGSMLKFSYTALGTEPPPPLEAPEELLRLVSPLEALKGRMVCAAETADNVRLTLEIPTRGLSRSEVKRIVASHERGDILRLSLAQRRPIGVPASGMFRVESPKVLHTAYAPQQK